MSWVEWNFIVHLLNYCSQHSTNIWLLPFKTLVWGIHMHLATTFPSCLCACLCASIITTRLCWFIIDIPSLVLFLILDPMFLLLSRYNYFSVVWDRASAMIVQYLFFVSLIFSPFVVYYVVHLKFHMVSDKMIDKVVQLGEYFICIRYSTRILQYCTAYGELLNIDLKRT